MAKILIVEDERTLNEAYELILKKQGHDVDVAYNGDEALKVFQQL
jgi:DNA-binding response OmpR family regulator